MIDYRKTLNLPQTEFPMKANLAQREPEFLKFWAEINLYERLRKQGKDRPLFILHDGPPYANGPIHLGTSLNKILKDIVIKSQTFNGFNAPFVPGWDCHGLPIELKVEKTVGKPGKKISPTDFRRACREFANSQVALQKQDFQRLGVIADWAHPYLTMSRSFEAETVRALATIIAQGHLYRGQKPIHWCTDCGSALAEAEVEYQNKVSFAIDVAFTVVDPSQLSARFSCELNLAQVAVPIWTTTPWTLPANEAVAVNPTSDYVLVETAQKAGQTVFLVAKNLLNEVMARYELTEYQVLATTKGVSLEFLLLQHPFLPRTVPLLLGDHVTTESGTGNVHTAPAHGQEDYLIGQHYQLPMNNPVDSRSCFIPGTPLVEGLHVSKANEPIIEALASSQHLLHLEKIEHSYPHCWRHKTALIFRATPQWFIAMDQGGLREMALRTIDKEVTWLPHWGRNRIHSMISSRPDWCISRQRTWGTPIPLFIHKETQEPHPNTAQLMQTIADLIESQGIEAWFQAEVKDFLPTDHAHYDKINDVLDVWFDSGVSHSCVLAHRPELRVPADLYLEGSDQHRGWFQTSLLTSLAIRKTSPFKKVITHGYVVDGKGHKMSKSLGNTVLPSQVVQQYGADILRLWVASSDFSGDIHFSDEILKRVVDSYRRIRNTARFLISNLYDFNPKQDSVPVDQLLALDVWALQTTQRLQKDLVQYYNDFQFQLVCQRIHHFCSIEMGGFYLDILKDRQYTGQTRGIPRRSSQTALYFILESLVHWLAPILSFTAEEIWQSMPGVDREDSVFLSRWFTSLPDLTQRQDRIDWERLIEIRDLVNKVLESKRAHGGGNGLGSSLEAVVSLQANKKDYECLQQLGNELPFFFITSEVNVVLNETISHLIVEVNVSSHPQCERCWQHAESVGKIEQHPTICERCVLNVFGEGERRHYV